jgi:Cu2+-exporting ATPase
MERLGSAAWCGTDPDVHQLWYRQGKQAPTGFQLHDELRPDAAAMIQGLQQRNMRVEILSGDNALIVSDIAARVGVTDWDAGFTPQQKATRLQSLSAQGYRVLMVGDGINDAAAMALAHVSIAPGTATDISQRASDMVLRGNDLMPILEAYDVGRKARRLVLQNFALAAIYNLTAIPMDPPFW